MPTYRIKAPDGNVYKIDGPDGASNDDVIAAVLAQHPDAGTAPEPIPLQGAPGEVVAPQATPTPKTGLAEVGDYFSEAYKNARGDRVGNDSDADWGKKFIGDTSIPNIAPARILGNIIDMGAAAGELMGAGFDTAFHEMGNGQSGSLGGVAEDLMNMTGGHSNFVGGIGKAMSNPARLALANEGNALFKSGATAEEMQAWAKQKGLNPFGGDLDTAIAARDKGMPTGAVRDVNLDAKLSAEAEAFKKVQSAPSKLEEEAKAFKPKAEPTADEVFDPNGAKTPEAVLENKLQSEADAFLNKKEDVPVEAPQNSNVDDVVNQINDKTADWKNPPEFEVHQNFDGVDGVDPDAIGAIGNDGKVHINASKIDSPEKMSAVIYHEALGHHGLTKKFGAALDDTLEKFYNESTDFRATVDKWMEDNPGAYESNSVARAADEVLAEMSENGVMPVTLKNRIKNMVKDLGRKMGLKLEYSDREIETILGQAHDAVINGKTPRENGYAGTRYMRDRKKTLSPDSMETQNDISDLLDFTANNLGEKETYSIPELSRMADNLGLNARKYVNQKGFTEEKLAARLLAAKQIFTNTSEELAGLGEKLRTEGYSPSLHAKIREKLAMQEAIAAKLDGDTAEAGRALRVLREVSKSRKTAAEQARYMAEKGGEDILSNPESLSKFMDEYTKLGTTEEKISLLKKVKKGGLLTDTLNIPRTLMSTLDLSAPFRQGLFLIGRKEFWKSFAGMFKQFGSEKAHAAVMEDIRSRPTYPLMQSSGLELTGDTFDLTKREEQFMSRTVTKLPGVRHSERAYSGFLNKLRADVFDDLIKKSRDAGIELGNDPKAVRDIAKYINNATGRGDMGSWNSAAPMLSSVFFSPRLIASRVNMLNPWTYLKPGLNPVVRRESIKNLLALGSIALTVTSLAKAAGADVETDPTSSDFAKIKTGNTRYDILGGFGQYITLGARIRYNQTKNAKGNVKDLGNPKEFKSETRGDKVVQFGRNKLAPIPSFLMDYLYGKDSVGNKFEMSSAVAKRFIPLFMQDLKDVYDDEGNAASAAVKAAPGVFGVGVQTYDVDKPREDKYGY